MSKPPLEIVSLTQAEFDALLEYSCTLPTGTKIGTRWKRLVLSDGKQHWPPTLRRPDLVAISETWYLGEYVPCEQTGTDKDVGIRWREIVIVELARGWAYQHGDAPPGHVEPATPDVVEQMNDDTQMSMDRDRGAS